MVSIQGAIVSVTNVRCANKELAHVRGTYFPDFHFEYATECLKHEEQNQGRA
jgi:hypothetical protein